MRAALPFLAAFVVAACASSPESPVSEHPRAASEPSHATATIDKGDAPVADGVAPAGEFQAKTAAAVEPENDGRKRLGALGPHTWIWKKPSRDGLAIGRMRIGTSVALRSPDPVDGPDCKGKWYAIEPRGYVCDDDTATLDLDDPYYKVLEFSAPAPGVWPYHYAHSNGTPMYSRVPTDEEAAKAEKEYGPVNTWKPLGAWAAGHEELIVDEPIKATDEVPYFLKDGQRTAPGGNFDTRVLVWKRMPPGSMLSYSRAFEMHGRVWLLTPDAMVIPADRVSKLRRSTFEGIHFDKSELRLPFAWNRTRGPLPIYEKDANGKLVATSETVPAKSPVEISDGKLEQGDWVYYELRKNPGHYVGKTTDPKKQLDVELVITRPATSLPKGIDPNEKWIEAHTVPGTLTAYIGLQPVMSTLFSPGKGGPPAPGYKFPQDHAKYATTALGTFPLEWKEHVATMSNEHGEPKVLWFTDVPNQQYLRAPLAMHVAFWHEDFGKRKSAECLNVSPIDGAWLFGWTLPNLPEGWNGVGAGQGNGVSTPVVVTTN